MTAAEEFVIPRDRWGRPQVQQADGSMVGYTRISTLAKELDDGAGLKYWGECMVGIGLALDEDLMSQIRPLVTVPNPYAENKKLIHKLVERAQEVAGSTVKRELGTELHSWFERYDLGMAFEDVPQEFQRDLDSYRWATLNVGTLDTETFVVVDEIQAAGSLDRLNTYRDRIVVGDVKTGQSDSDRPMAVEMQVSCYAHGERYDFETGERTPLHPDIDTSLGLLIHAPSEQGRCDIYELDLERGWANVQLALKLREARKVSGRKLKAVK